MGIGGGVFDKVYGLLQMNMISRKVVSPLILPKKIVSIWDSTGYKVNNKGYNY